MFHAERDDRRTLPWAVRQQDQSKILVHDDIVFAFSVPPHPAAITQGHLALACKTSDHSDNVLGRFVCFIDDDHAPGGDSSKERRVFVLEDAPFEDCYE